VLGEGYDGHDDGRLTVNASSVECSHTRMSARSRIRRAARWLGVLTPMLWAFASHPALAQTPSPLQEWQYPGGISLYKLFEPNLPEWHTTLGVAADLEPFYSGSRPYHVSGGPVIDIRYFDVAFASVGEGIGYNFIHAANIRAGVAIGYDLGRSMSEEYGRLYGLGNIDPAPVVKLFVSYVISKQVPVIFRADIRQFVGGADGAVGDFEVFMPLPGSSERLIMLAGPSVTFADGLYLRKEYGVSAAQARASGYPEFNAHAGVSAIGFGFSATRIMNSHWLINAEVAATRLLGSASASPITELTLQGVFALSFAYQWQ
jgi:outer membrane scaffolding protein for murein synthesis (MipA/OmpV family)